MRSARCDFDHTLRLIIVAFACLLAGVNVVTADLDDGLVGYWSFDEGSGATVYDYSGYGNHGTRHGTSWVEGASGNALWFNGSDDYVSVPDHPIFDPGGAITISAWINTLFPSAGDAIAAHDHSQATWLLYASGTDQTACSVYVRTASYWNRIGGAGDLSDGYWHHVVGTFDRSLPSGRLRFYVDGILYGTNDAYDEDILPGDEGVEIGRHWCGSAQDGFHGIIDEVRVYDRALSHDEILDLYWSTTHPDPQNDTTDGDKSDVSGTSSDPVNTATGSFFHQETDLSIPSRGSPLVFTRYYNSKAAASAAKSGKSGQTAAKSEHAPPKRKSTTSQPASTKHGECSGVDGKKRDESPGGSSNPRPTTKEDGK